MSGMHPVRYLVVLALVSTPTLAGGAPSPLGGKCTAKADCVSGAHCSMGVCELPGPCAAFQAGGHGFGERRATYDAEGYEVFVRDLHNGTVSFEARTTHFEDYRRWEVDVAWGSPPQPKERQTYVLDANLMPLRIEKQPLPEGSEGDTSVEVLDWSGPRRCRRPAYKVYSDLKATKLAGRAESKCGKLGTERVRRYEGTGADERLVSEQTYAYDAQGRVRVTRFKRMPRGEGDEGFEAGHKFLRAPTGHTIGMRYDNDGDGIYETREVWDLSCWDIGPRGVKAAPEPGVSKRPGPTAKAIEGRWKQVDDGRFGLTVNFERSSVTLSDSKRDEKKEAPMTFEQEAGHTVVLTARPKGDKPMRLELRLLGEGADRFLVGLLREDGGEVQGMIFEPAER